MHNKRPIICQNLNGHLQVNRTAKDAEANHLVINSPSLSARYANSCAINIVVLL